MKQDTPAVSDIRFFERHLIGRFHPPRRCMGRSPVMLALIAFANRTTG